MRKLIVTPALALFFSLFCHAVYAHEAHTQYQANHLAISVAIDGQGTATAALVSNRGMCGSIKALTWAKHFRLPVKVNGGHEGGRRR